MSEDEYEDIRRKWEQGPEEMPLGEFKRQLRMRHERQAANKERITMRIDRDVLVRLKERAGEGSYQALINAMLRAALDAEEMDAPLRKLEGLIERFERASEPESA